MVFLRVHLEPPGLVAHINEHGLAHLPVRRDPSSHRDFASFGVIIPRVFARFRGGKLVFERVNALGAQGRQFGPPLFNQ